MSPKQPLIVDCDTGIDDALALLYLLHDPAVDLRAVTSVFGNTDATTAADNTLRVLQLAGRQDVPVAIGAHTNWRGGFHPAPHVHGSTGLGAANTLPPPTTTPSAEPAAELIVRTAREHPGAVRLLAIGPLTNLANALLLEPELPHLVSHVTIMGGAIHHPGNITPAAEANIHNDPEAAQMVLQADWDVTLVPLDATMTETITDDARQRLHAFQSPITSFAAEILDYYLGYYEHNVFGTRAAACHDPLAAGIAVGDVPILLGRTHAVEVDTGDGPTRGATTAATRAGHRDISQQVGTHTRLVLRTDGNFADRLTERLCTPSQVHDRVAS